MGKEKEAERELTYANLLTLVDTGKVKCGGVSVLLATDVKEDDLGVVRRIVDILEDRCQDAEDDVSYDDDENDALDGEELDDDD